MTKSIKIKLNLTDNTIFDTSKLNNKTVLFFYPKAMTSGCSIEVQDFQKKLTTFKKLGFDALPHYLRRSRVLRNGRHIVQIGIALLLAI